MKDFFTYLYFVNYEKKLKYDFVRELLMVLALFYPRVPGINLRIYLSAPNFHVYNYEKVFFGNIRYLMIPKR